MFCKIIVFLALVAVAFAQPPFVKRVRIVLEAENLRFIPFNTNSPTSVNDGGTPTPGEVNGSFFLANGFAFPSDQVTVINDLLVGPKPTPEPGFVFTSKCTVTDGFFLLTAPIPTEFICSSSLCFGDAGCTFFRYGGPIAGAALGDSTIADLDLFPPFDQYILGGTGIFNNLSGKAQAVTISAPIDNPNGEQILEIILPPDFPTPF